MESASMDIMSLNNFLTSMRPLCKRAKLHVINKLAKKLKFIKKEKSYENKEPASLAKFSKIYDEIQMLKTLKFDAITKYSLSFTSSYAKIAINGSSDERALARLAENKILSDKINTWRQSHSDWKSLSAFLSSKNTGRRMKKKPKKTQKPSSSSTKCEKTSGKTVASQKTSNEVSNKKSESKVPGDVDVNDTTLQTMVSVVSDSVSSDEMAIPLDINNVLSNTKSEDTVVSDMDVDDAAIEPRNKPITSDSPNTVEAVFSLDISEESSNKTSENTVLRQMDVTDITKKSEDVNYNSEGVLEVLKFNQNMVVTRINFDNLEDDNVETDSPTIFVTKPLTNSKPKVLSNIFFANDTSDVETNHSVNQIIHANENKKDYSLNKEVDYKSKLESTFLGRLSGKDDDKIPNKNRNYERNNGPRSKYPKYQKSSFQNTRKGTNVPFNKKPEKKTKQQLRQDTFHEKRRAEAIAPKAQSSHSTSSESKNTESNLPIHPSWEASKRRKEQAVIPTFQGKKITFDDD